MKLMKMLGLAVCAAGLMAFVGASTASAETTVCKVTEEPCSAANSYGVGTEIEAVSVEGGGLKKATLTSGSFFGSNIECDVIVKGISETSTTPSGKSFSIAFSNCLGGTAETATSGSLVVHHDAEHNGRLVVEGAVIKVVQSGVTCYYGGVIESTGTGGESRLIHITTAVHKITTAPHASSFLCPTEPILHATAKVTKPAGPGYVTTGV